MICNHCLTEKAKHDALSKGHRTTVQRNFVLGGIDVMSHPESAAPSRSEHLVFWFRDIPDACECQGGAL